MTPDDLSRHKRDIDTLDQIAMARLWRFAPTGHPYFSCRELADYFTARFDALGGMTPAISKAIGWGKEG